MRNLNNLESQSWKTRLKSIRAHSPGVLTRCCNSSRCAESPAKYSIPRRQSSGYPPPLLHQPNKAVAVVSSVPSKSLGNDGPQNGNRAPNRLNLNVKGDLHLQPNDIAELRKLADSHPELAQQIANDRRDQTVLENNTERLGMLFAAVLGIVLIVGTSLTLISLGWWQSIMFVAALLGISHILRTLLKGEFSDTSWFGQVMKGTAKPGDGAES